MNPPLKKPAAKAGQGKTGSNIDPSIAIEKKLDDLLLKFNESEKEKSELKRQLEELTSKAAEFNVNAAVATAKNSATPEAVVPYPASAKKAEYIIEKEKEFVKYGVGEKSITFEFINNIPGNKSLFILKHKDKVTYRGSVINMLYAVNHESPFIVDHPKGSDWVPEVELVLFSEGRIIVPPSNPCLQRFLLSHSKYGRKFKVFDQAEADKLYNENHEKIIKANAAVLAMFDSKDEYEPRYFASFAIDPATAESSPLESLKRDLIATVTHSPIIVDQYKSRKNEFKIKYIGQAAIAMGFLSIKGNVIYTGEGRQFCPMSSGDFHESFYKYCSQNSSPLSNIKEKVGIV